MTPTLRVLPSRRDGLDFFVGGLILERHLVTDEFQVFSVLPGAAPAGSTCRRTLVPRLAADELHDIVQAPADDIRERAFVALADADDAIVRR